MIHDVAISYASEDGDRARELYDELRTTNLSIYFDGDDTERVRSWGKDLRKTYATSTGRRGAASYTAPSRRASSGPRISTSSTPPG